MGKKYQNPRGRVITHVMFMHRGAMQNVGTILWEKNTCSPWYPWCPPPNTINKREVTGRWRLLHMTVVLRRPRQEKVITTHSEIGTKTLKKHSPAHA